MNIRSEQYITKSNGFSLPLSRMLGHPHIEVLRFAADTQASFADLVNVAAFFLTNSCTLSGLRVAPVA
jgi:hypothetical protein